MICICMFSVRRGSIFLSGLLFLVAFSLVGRFFSVSECIDADDAANHDGLLFSPDGRRSRRLLPASCARWSSSLRYIFNKCRFEHWATQMKVVPQKYIKYIILHHSSVYSTAVLRNILHNVNNRSLQLALLQNFWKMSEFSKLVITISIPALSMRNDHVLAIMMPPGVRNGCRGGGSLVSHLHRRDLIT